MSFFNLYYEYYEIDKPELNVEKMIGFYSSYDKCLNALIRYKNQVEFSKSPECLIIESIKFSDNIDNSWIEGFVVDDE